MIVNTGFPFQSFVTSLHNLGYNTLHTFVYEIKSMSQVYTLCTLVCKSKHITILHIVQLFTHRAMCALLRCALHNICMTVASYHAILCYHAVDAMLMQCWCIERLQLVVN